MGAKTDIEWTKGDDGSKGATWNPVTGCTKISAGCDHCYAERITERFHGPGSFAKVQLHEDRIDLPLRWRKPRRVFVNSMADLFHEDVPDLFLERVFDVMEQAAEHTFQVLTKRHARMRSFVRGREQRKRDYAAKFGDCPTEAMRNSPAAQWARKRAVTPPANIWLGVSVEDQKWADIRIPALLDTPAAVRFLSCEPLLGPVNIWHWIDPSDPCVDCDVCGEERFPDEIGFGHDRIDLYYGEGHPDNSPEGGEGWCPGPSEGALPRRIDWVIVGGESGPGARPMHPDWPREIRDHCEHARVPFFFKQWGAYRWVAGSRWDEATECWVDHGIEPQRVPKHLSGRELDGRTWDEYPQAAVA